jgi:hypothetical protein
MNDTKQLSENEGLETYLTEIPKIYEYYKSLPNKDKDFMKNPKINELNNKFLSVLTPFSNTCKHEGMHISYSCLFEDGFDNLHEKYLASLLHHKSKINYCTEFIVDKMCLYLHIKLNHVLLFDKFYEHTGTVTSYSKFCCRCNKYIKMYTL